MTYDEAWNFLNDFPTIDDAVRGGATADEWVEAYLTVEEGDYDYYFDARDCGKYHA